MECITGFRFTNNVLSTAQQVWLRKLGGAKPVVTENASGIITAGRAKRSAAQPARQGERSLLCATSFTTLFYRCLTGKELQLAGLGN